MEFQDWDMSLRSEDGSLDGTDIEKYYKALLPAFEKAGYNTRPGPSLEKWFQEAGFINIGVKQYRVPLGNWPKDPYYVCTHLGLQKVRIPLIFHRVENHRDVVHDASGTGL